MPERRSACGRGCRTGQCPPGRPKGAVRGLREVVPDVLRRGVGRHPRSQTRPSGLGFALLAQTSLGGPANGVSAGGPSSPAGTGTEASPAHAANSTRCAQNAPAAAQHRLLGAQVLRLLEGPRSGDVPLAGTTGGAREYLWRSAAQAAPTVSFGAPCRGRGLARAPVRASIDPATGATNRGPARAPQTKRRPGTAHSRRVPC